MTVVADLNTGAEVGERAPAPVQSATSSRRATVLQLLPALGQAGGVERGSVEIAAAVVEAGGRAIVVSSGGPLVHDLSRAGAEHLTLPVDRKTPWAIRANAEKLAEIVRAENVDILHARSRAPAWSAAMAARRTDRAFVTTFHGTYGSSNWLKRRYNGVMVQGDRVIAISNFIASHVRRFYGVPVRRIRVIHRGVDLRRFAPEQVSAERVIKLAIQWRLPDGAPVVMLPGRLTRWKGQELFIDAIAELGRGDLCCLLVGPDQGRTAYRRELEARIADKGLERAVRLVDHCDDMPAAYMLADVVVSASTAPEAFGRVVAEAQAMGRPVVATDHGGAREIVIPGETGRLVTPASAAALAQGLEVVLSLSGAARQRQAERAIGNVRANFSTEVMAAKTLDVYDEVLAPAATSG